MFYFSIYFVASFLSWTGRKIGSIGDLLYYIFLLTFFALCAFRFEVGCDWIGYQNQFFYGRAFEIGDAASQVRDPLWWVLIGFLNRLGLDYLWLNVISTLIAFSGFHVIARRQPDKFAFLVFLFPVLLVHIGMSGIRQAAAIGIICIALTAFIDRRPVHFVLWVLLASTIHSSAMVFLLLAPIASGRYSRGRLALAALLAIPGLLLLLGSAAAEVAIDRYVGTDRDAAGAVFRLGLLLLTGLVFFTFLRRHWLNSGAPDYSLVSIGSIGMVALIGLLPLSTVIPDRLGYYFVPIQAIILSRIPYLELGRPRGLLVFSAYALLGLTLLVWVLLSSHYEKCYVPYQTWLFGTPASRLGL